eukprot:m51a1_g10156 putative oligosaccharyl transferase-like protein (795) ;mRNA; f:17231-19885
MGNGYGAALLAALRWAVLAAAAAAALAEAYRIRLYAVRTYGRVIHEFDPWFNYRAAQYLADHGLGPFFAWYDHQSWYPLGRPVGTTIYPGMQLTAVALWRALNQLSPAFIAPVSLNDVCVLVPAWFGALAAALVGLMTYEAAGTATAGVAATAVMAVIPAHLMRSVAGGFDNECVAISALCATFWLWLRSLRSPPAWPLGAAAGLAYAYMAASWGGYVFAGNMVALHAAALVALGRWSPALHRSYSLFWLVGTALASRVPVVGMAPFRSLEQAAPMALFAGMQVLAALRWHVARRGLSWEENAAEVRAVYARVLGVCAAAGGAVLASGALWPLSTRVASLFVKHTRTGNPLVDSVAEHQPASNAAYFAYLNVCYVLMMPGVALAMGRGAFERAARCHGVAVAKSFLLLYALVALYFSNRMNRLILLMGPIASALSGIVVGDLVDWVVAQFREAICCPPPASSPSPVQASRSPAPRKARGSAAAAAAASASEHPLALYGLEMFAGLWDECAAWYRSRRGFAVRLCAAGALALLLTARGVAFWRMCDVHAQHSSQPSVMFQATLRKGEAPVVVRDYMDAYEWLRDNTPEDSRVLAWWDYGYHITGIANRTSIADGNTWNLEHIATIGRIMTAPEKKGWGLARMIADYVLVWAGNHGDDLSKSPHLARIATSVYDDVCPLKDPLCYSFGFKKDGSPTASMARSMLYKMHSAGVRPGVAVDPTLFKEVYTSKYGLVRIYQILDVDLEAKRWVADPRNRVCDHEGSWYCVGQYPPGFPKPPQTHRHIPVHYYQQEPAME